MVRKYNGRNPDVDNVIRRHEKAFNSIYYLGNNWKYRQRQEEVLGCIVIQENLEGINGVLKRDIDRIKDDGKSSYLTMLKDQYTTNRSHIALGQTFYENAPPGKEIQSASFDRTESHPSTSNANDPLEQLKGRICQLLDDYISSGTVDLRCFTLPKLGIFGFGHHHNDRARGVKWLICDAESVVEIKDILDNQKSLFEKKEINANHVQGLDEEWNRKIKNRPSNPNDSEYYRQILTAFDDYQKQYPDDNEASYDLQLS